MPTLILIPTRMEMEKVLATAETQGLKHLNANNVRIEVCGFGPVAAAAKATSLLHTDRPDSVILIGIAGSLSDELTIGDAYTFSDVFMDDIGAGSGENFVSAKQMGWKFIDEPAIEDELAIRSDQQQGLLTVCSASASAEEVQRRQELFPTVTAEDMEGYSVAMACALQNVPLTIVRGVSNRAGDRNHANWKIDAAIDSAAKLADRLIGEQT